MVYFSNLNFFAMTTKKTGNELILYCGIIEAFGGSGEGRVIR